MTGYVALFRSMDNGGCERTLPMSTLAEMCAASGRSRAQTFVADGNVVFQSDSGEHDLRFALESRLRNHGTAIDQVVLRTASELADVIARNPFPDAAGNRVLVLFSDASLPSDPFSGMTGVGNERIQLGRRELFIFYPDGMAVTRLRLANTKTGVGRNMITVAKLAEMAEAFEWGRATLSVPGHPVAAVDDRVRRVR